MARSVTLVVFCKDPGVKILSTFWIWTPLPICEPLPILVESMSQKFMRESLKPMVLVFDRLLPMTLMASALANRPLTPVNIADVILMVLPPCECERFGLCETRQSVGV